MQEKLEIPAGAMGNKMIGRRKVDKLSCSRSVSRRIETFMSRMLQQLVENIIETPELERLLKSWNSLDLYQLYTFSHSDVCLERLKYSVTWLQNDKMSTLNVMIVFRFSLFQCFMS